MRKVTGNWLLRSSSVTQTSSSAIPVRRRFEEEQLAILPAHLDNGACVRGVGLQGAGLRHQLVDVQAAQQGGQPPAAGTGQSCAGHARPVPARAQAGQRLLQHPCRLSAGGDVGVVEQEASLVHDDDLDRRRADVNAQKDRDHRSMNLTNPWIKLQ